MDHVTIDGVIFESLRGELKRVCLSGYDTERELQVMRKNGIRGLCVARFFCGKRINNLDFLKNYPEITDVLISVDNIDCTGLRYLSNLEVLLIEGDFISDYSVFPSLRVLSTQQRKIIALPQKLEDLSLYGCVMKGNSLRAFDFPSTMKCLRITLSRIESLEGAPDNLKCLELNHIRKLTSLGGIEGSSNTLSRVEINNCHNISDYAPLASCLNLEKLYLRSCAALPDIEFVKEMHNLKQFSFYDTLVSNCDLAPLFSVPYVYFKNNKNYNYRFKDFKTQAQYEMERHIDSLFKSHSDK